MLIFPSIKASVVNDFFGVRINPKGAYESAETGIPVKKLKHAQADQFQDDNVDTNLTPVNHRNQNDVYCKIW